MTTILDQDTAPATPPVAHETRAERKQRSHNGPKHSHTALVLGLGFALWLFVGFVTIHLLHNTAAVPGWIIIGAALVPSTVVWSMAHRLTASDSLTGAKLVQTVLIGGALSFSLGATLDQLVELIPQPDSAAMGNGVIALALAGFVEEFAKGAIIVAVGWNAVKTARNGLFIGGSVGAGFAILETVSYIIRNYAGDSPVYAAAQVTAERGLLAPFMHILWSALLGAAIFAAAKNRRFGFSAGLLGTYVLVSVLHGSFDGGGSLISIAVGDTAIGGVLTVPIMLIVTVIGFFTWRHVARKNRAVVNA
ncbi:PrsW family intramembrane metalloprotease [Herbiconiux sp. L3-i23]|uniref:PrsW family intramembrane metalloprotease n=1 Tax=Herbiconiux sp. L3-i23 TaxID=2905871 RepID=UPI002068B311|nr:PrsW family glutamic-type intramembrane protease [Herbiconiux sp. L3-i23]BDI22929.1 hypothetical protein L3i23_17050 [Herbiconiux sp. L3-i23]